jgi:pyruvate,water dikinase
MSEADPLDKKITDTRKEREIKFLEQFDQNARNHAEDLLDLARASYRLRDDDNMYLGRIEREMIRAVDLAKKRRDLNIPRLEYPELIDEIARALRDENYQPGHKKPMVVKNKQSFEIQARQLIGQPAGQGLATGPARVVKARGDLTNFHNGEVLVCDAIDPNMTMVVPMSAAIIERRGGMLIHGAIIAREYGIPCVTGVPEATQAIQDGDIVTVDGFLGIITIRKDSG